MERYRDSGLNIRVVASDIRRGPGNAVRRGVLAAEGRRILISDADGPVPFEDTMLLWKALDRGVDLAAGSRVKDPAKLIQSQPGHRVFMGKVWRAITGQMVPTGIRDTQCGFKLSIEPVPGDVFVP